MAWNDSITFTHDGAIQTAMKLENWLAQHSQDFELQDIKILVQERLKLGNFSLALIPDVTLNSLDMKYLTAALVRMRAGESVGRVLGYRWFYNHPFKLSPATLEPRPDSELIVEQGLKFLSGFKNPSVLDLGTGTGCFLLSILAEIPDAQGIGLDLSMEAVNTARENAADLRLNHRSQILRSDWTSALDKGLRFDLIVSNPPYVVRSVIEGLSDTVRNYDPRLALDGGMDGLDAYRRLSVCLKPFLKQHGLVILEIGYDQADRVTEIFKMQGWNPLGTLNDLSGHNRACLFDLGL